MEDQIQWIESASLEPQEFWNECMEMPYSFNNKDGDDNITSDQYDCAFIVEFYGGSSSSEGKSTVLFTVCMEFMPTLMEVDETRDPERKLIVTHQVYSCLQTLGLNHEAICGEIDDSCICRSARNFILAGACNYHLETDIIRPVKAYKTFVNDGYSTKTDYIIKADIVFLLEIFGREFKVIYFQNETNEDAFRCNLNELSKDILQSMEGRLVSSKTLFVVDVSKEHKSLDYMKKSGVIERVYQASTSSFTSSRNFLVLNITEIISRTDSSIVSNECIRLGSEAHFSLKLEIKSCSNKKSQFPSTVSAFYDINEKDKVHRMANKELIEDLISLSKCELQFARPTAILIMGGPGVGKTTMAKDVVSTMKKQNKDIIVANFSISDLMHSMDVFQATKLILEPFKATSVNASSRSILVLDEIHLLYTLSEKFREVCVLLIHAVKVAITTLKGMNYMTWVMGIFDDSVVKIGNDLLSPGFFEKVVRIPPPSNEERKLMLKNSITKALLRSDQRQNSTIKSNDLIDRWAEMLAKQTNSFSYSDLNLIVRRALVFASSRTMSDSDKAVVKEDESVISWNDLERSTRDIIPSQLSLFDVMKPQTKMNMDAWESFIGYEEVKERVQRNVLNPWHQRTSATGINFYSTFEINAPSGVLFHGPSGNGKSALALCVSNALGVCVIKVKAADVLDKWLGGSEANIRSIFARARASAPCAILFDDIDALASNRDNTSGADIHSRILSTLLNEMDGISSDKNKKDIVVIGTTNRLEGIDAALLRPGRLHEHIYVDYPNVNDCVDMLKYFTRKMPLDNSLSIPQLAEVFVKSRVASFDVKRICRDACIEAIRRNDRKSLPPNVNFEDFIKQISK